MSAGETVSIAADTPRLEAVLQRYRRVPASLISVLEDLNEEFRYLPRPVLEHVSMALNVPLNQIYHVATFYKVFNLAPQGKHTICVCEGTACHVKGAGAIMEKLQEQLRVSEGGTTEDGQFTLRSVRCLGCCALAPAVMVDHDVHGELQLDETARLLSRYADRPDDA